MKGPANLSVAWPSRLTEQVPKAPPLQRLPWPSGLAELGPKAPPLQPKEELANQKAYEDLKAAAEAETAAEQQQLETEAGESADTDEKTAQAPTASGRRLRGGASGRRRGNAEEDAIGAYNATTVNDKIFEELRLSPDVVLDIQNGWKAFLDAAGSREAAGEKVFAALWAPAPALPRDSTEYHCSAYLFQGLSLIIDSLSDPKGLMVVVETLGKQHLDLEITGPRVIRFRDAIVGLMGARLSQKAKVGFATMLNYVGGSYIFIRRSPALRNV